VCSSGAVLTSATAHYGNAEHTLEHYGLSNVADRATVLELPSPFNLKENTKAFVAQHISHKDDGIPDFAEMCGKITEMLEGRTLALFTSYKALKQTKEALEQNLKGKNIKILTQQAGQPAILLIEQLKRDPHCIVLATSALWTGIDIPGDHLSAVLVHKLPFDVPDRYTKEMAEYLFAARGINHFRDVSVPTAINRLLQGIGRLVRTEEDRGIVIIADNRCQSATYGSEFKHALKNYNWRSISKTSELPSPEELRVYCRIPAKNMAKMR
jgi:ATP-dependent DNA helicase DinG